MQIAPEGAVAVERLFPFAELLFVDLRRDLRAIDLPVGQRVGRKLFGVDRVEPGKDVFPICEAPGMRVGRHVWQMIVDDAGAGLGDSLALAPRPFGLPQRVEGSVGGRRGIRGSGEGDDGERS